jgi:hypothetical protein
MKESDVHKQLIAYIKLQYPNTIVSSDPNGLKVTMGQAKQLKAMRLPDTGGHPDIFIFRTNKEYSGCFIEVKKEGEKIFKVRPFPPEYRTPHLEKQGMIHDKLRLQGYFGGFGIGFEGCKDIIDEYMKIN